MQLAAYIGLLFALLGSLFLAGYACLAAWNDRERASVLLERGQLVATALVVYASGVLFMALAARHYGFLYVYENVDNTLPLAYTLTAFWAGQEGSLLFWELIMAVCGAVFLHTAGYKDMQPRTKNAFWAFFFTIQAFFLLLLTSWSNPFLQAAPTPADGTGMNPLLQNPGMIFHPPLLFLGFALFVIPACAALAGFTAAEPKPWVRSTRNWTVLAWAFLTAGITLGGWWSYMELGWGGYWAWDPVENASLIPWFSATAFIHTALIESRRGALQRTNVLLMAGTFLLCVFSTYLTRSGVIQSLHAFGGGGGGALPLLLFLLAGSALGLVVVFLGERPVYRSLSGMLSRQGLLVATAWAFLALGVVVTLATMWPVISLLWSQQSVGLGPDFYNRVCLPLFALVVLLFMVCPWLGWKQGVRHRWGLLAVGVVFVAGLAGFFAAGITKPLALVAAAGASAALASAVLPFVLLPGTARLRRSFGAYGVHAGLALVALGIAFSGPYKLEREVTLDEGQTTVIGDFEFTYAGHVQDSTRNLRARAVATLEVDRDGADYGVLHPELRIYRNFDQQFAEVSTIFSLGDEVYATLLGFSPEGAASFKISVNPLVNWVWIGSVVMSLAPLLLLKRRRLP